jgi:ankyrin repeat protein
MEDLCKRFPHLGALIFANLDDQTFTKCKEANKEISQFFNGERFCWIRIIRHYHDNFETFQESWKEAINKTSVENVKQLAVAVQKFFKLHPVSSHKKVAPLHIAAEQENLPLCEHIISKLKDKNPQGNLFIINEHTFESKFRFEIWREKSYFGARVHTKTTALHIAALKSNLELFKLIANNIDERNPKNNEGYTPLHIAAAHGHQELFKFIVKDGEENPRNNYGRTPLHMAARNGHIVICQFIVEKVDNKNPAQDYNLWTPLLYASSYGHFEVCKFLVERVGNKNPANNLGRTPLHLAAGKGNMKIPSQLAKYEEHLKIFKLISDKVRNNNPSDNYGSTPMHIAAKEGNFEVCKIIIDKNKKKRKKNRQDINPFGNWLGWTPLHFAADNGHLEICRLIIDNVENKNPRSEEYRKTPKDVAEAKNHTEIVKLFDKM